MCSEEGREHHDVAEQKDPEAVAGNHALCGRPAFAVTGCMHVAAASAGADPITAVADPVRIAGALERGIGGGHAGWPACCASHRSRACRPARSNRATSSAGIEDSLTSPHPHQTKTAEAATNPRATIHQMCQISAKPVIVQKKAVMNPVGLFLGISIGSYRGSADICCASIARRLISQ